MRINRRVFAGLGLAPALVGLQRKTDRTYAGGFVFESQERGHRIRDRARFAPQGREKARVVIVGGGMSGLCAAWWLEKHGFRDFVILEMEPQAGGNSRSGENEISAYPWGAHYIPVPDRKSVLVREMLEEFGAFRDGEWNERYLCHAPQERFFIHGRWQEGIDFGAERALEELVHQYRISRAFTIPLALGQERGKFAALDRMTFQEWLQQQVGETPAMRWLCDYATRDDYGTRAAETSAWAGIHYFAARPAHGKGGPLTWPEGNGWMLRHLLRKLNGFVRTGQPVRRLRREGTGWRVETEGVEWTAEAVIFAAPAFLAPFLIEGFAPLPDLTYAPWMVSNLTLDRMPKGGAEAAWDNVIVNSNSLGYVVATHQSLRTHIDQTVWTHYWALAGPDPAAERRLLLKSSWGECCERVLGDLERVHPDIRQCVRRIDVFRNGHAMCRPTPGFLSSPGRKRLQAGLPGLAFAHADVSGISIFEEAQYRGVEAARVVLARLGGGGKR